jgi:PAS domain S-box-containing protein
MIRGDGPFQTEALNGSLLLLQVFMAVLGFAGLSLAAAAVERRESEASLRKARDELESQVQERTAEVARAVEALRAEVAEHRRTEAALRDSEERYRSVAETATDAIITVDEDSRIVYVNPAAEQIFGYSQVEMLGRTLTMLMPDTLMSGHLTSLKQFVATGTRTIPWRGVEFLGLHKSGKEIPLEISIGVFRRDGKHLFTGIIREVGERKRTEEALREAYERLQTIIHSSPLGILAVDPAGRIMSWNAGAEHIFGWSEREAIGRVCPTVPPEGLEDYHGMLARVVQGEIVTGLVRYRQKKGGGLIDASLSSAPLRNADGMATGAIIILEDITERKRAQDELIRSREQLRSLAVRLQVVREEERIQAAREVHDELGQTLTGLKIDIAWLADRLSKDQRPLLQKTESMLRSIDDTIQIVRRIASQLRPGVLDELGLVAAIQWQAQEFQARAGIRCRFTSQYPDVCLDQERSTALFRILQEALTNVARHSKATRGHINLETRDGHLILEVRDNGRGITKEEMSSAKSLGLLSMRERAHIFGGDVAIRGTPGRGTTVTIRIPLRAPNTVGAGT